MLENTHLASGGRVMPLEVAKAVRSVAQEAAVPIHLDGARLWNAAEATGLDPQAWCREADTVMVSLSKGLGAPVGRRGVRAVTHLEVDDEGVERAVHAVRRALRGL